MSTALTTTRATAIATSINIPDLIRRYFENKSPNTIAAYGRDLADFTHFMQCATVKEAVEQLLGGGPGHANAVVDSYRHDMLTRKRINADDGLAPATVNRRLSALRSIVSLAKRYGVIGWDLEVEGVSHETYRDTRGCGTDGFKKLLHAAESRGDAKGSRDAAILRLAYDLALRASSIADLDVGDVDLVTGEITYRVKGRNRRDQITKTLPRPTVEAIRRWVSVRGEASGPLFTNLDPARKGDGRLLAKSINAITHSYGRKAGVRRSNAHGLRHAGITRALELANGDVFAVADFSDHRDIRTVQKYNDNRDSQGSRLAALVANDAA